MGIYWFSLFIFYSLARGVSANPFGLLKMVLTSFIHLFAHDPHISISNEKNEEDFQVILKQ